MKISLTLAALVAWVSLSAQTRTVQGTVYDENGIGMVGVAVYDEADIANGVITDDKGRFAIEVSPSCKELKASFMGYILEVVPLDKASKIRMKPDTQSIQETVVTGIFTRKKDSFTGSVQTMSSEDIKRVGNQNLVQSLKNLDPSLLVLENLEQGSNPNAVASIQMRGASTLDAETTSLKSGYVSSGNTPLIILDGFETTLQKMQDMDMNRVQSITLLKDASAKAIYGSKGANGVIVIETKALTGERTLVTYTGSLSIEAPDLTSYTLCNALEKLEVEKREGYYDRAFDSSSWIAAQQLFEERYKRALEGESTYWLSKPLRVGVGNKHSLGIELGSKDLKALATFSYNNVEGTMKGSDRNILSGDVNLSYRRGKWTFRNIMSIANMKSNDSPYGTFDEYADLNPYYTPYDEDGNLKKVLSTGTYAAGENSWSYSKMITNPMYNATVGTSSTTGYLDFTDNFYAE
ncbi:MAG: TonB-dependent receptor plug domain-containing protein, partial [Candidatus Cryptobacteroides sp.]